MDKFEYRLIRSDRRTMRLEIGSKGIIVRAPLHASKAEIDSFILEHKDWIAKALAKTSAQREAAAKIQPLTYEEIKELADKALQVIPGRVKYYAEKLNVNYGRITIRNQKTRWGSCSSLNNLNFNCLLMLAPPKVLDSVVVHELCHLKEMNHSKSFYAEVLKVFPEYYECQQWLKEHGGELLARLG